MVIFGPEPIPVEGVLHPKSIGHAEFFCSAHCMDLLLSDTDEDLPEPEGDESREAPANEKTPVVSNPLLNQLFWPEPDMDSIADEFIAKLRLPKKEDQKKK